jgi:hypothetical protein
VTVSSKKVTQSILFKTGETDYYYLLESGKYNVESQYCFIQHGCLCENQNLPKVVLQIKGLLHEYSKYVEPVAPPAQEARPVPEAQQNGCNIL